MRNFEARIKKAEKQYLKGASFRRGMKIMEQIAQAHTEGNRRIIPNLLIKLWGNGHKSA